MPHSEHAGKEFTKKIFNILNPKTVLDIGAGAGTYSHFLREKNLQHWTCLEVWQPYIEQFELTSLYDKVIIEDVRKWIPEETYNFSILGDILEHMSLEESKEVLHRIRKISDYTIISIPLGTNPQGEHEGNPYEIHVEEYWDEEKVINNFGEPLIRHIETGYWCTIGVFVYSKLF
jgi:hypothetical protein